MHDLILSHKTSDIHPKTSPTHHNMTTSSNRSPNDSKRESDSSFKDSKYSYTHHKKKKFFPKAPTGASPHDNNSRHFSENPDDPFPSNKMNLDDDEDISILSGNDSSSDSKNLNLSHEMQSL